MNTSFQMFLLAARELNFTRAAEIAYVTPQCLSEHIKRIEENYGVTLFVRKPRIRLTEEGQAMLHYLTRIRALEDSMKNELADISGGSRGTLRLGVPVTRGNILIPRVVTRFREIYPNVDVEVHLNDTRNLEPLLLDGSLDLFLGVDASQHVLFRRDPLCREPLYLVISHNAMEEQFREQYSAVRKDFLEHGADLTRLQGVSFIQGHGNSTTTIAVEQFMLRNNIPCSFPIRVSNFDLHIDFCRMGHYATVCSQSQLRRIIEHPTTALEVYSIRGTQKYLNAELIEHRDAQPLAYRTAFAKLLKQNVLEENAAVCSWLKENKIIAFAI